MFPSENRDFARVQPGTGETPEEAAERHLLPYVRRADLTPGKNCRRECVPDRNRDTRDREGCVHQRERCLCGAQCYLLGSDPQFRGWQAFCTPKAEGWGASSGALEGEKRSRGESGLKSFGGLRKE